MDTILDKLGVYDFWGTFFPGLVGMIILRICGLDLIDYGKEKYLVYIVIVIMSLSYLLGIILHELGHFVQDHFIYKNGEPCDNFLLHNSIFYEDEKKIYLKLYTKWAKKNQIDKELDKKICRLFFNYCDYYISKNNNHIQSTKMQSIYGMSRSLFIFFGVIAVCGLIKLQLHIFIVSLSLLLLFYFRTIRFNEIRLKVVMRTYLVEIEKEK